MSKDFRIIDGKLKIVEIINNKIVRIIGDYKKSANIDKAEEDKYGKKKDYQKYKETKGPDAYRQDLLKRKVNLGFIKDSINLKSSSGYLNEWAKSKGYNSYEEYMNIVALARGFTCYREYEKVWRYYPGMPSPMKENRLDTRFLGIYIAENSVVKLFPGSQRMQLGNVGYDVICTKGYKLEVKAAVLNQNNNFTFHISRNMIADYFVLLGFNRITELKPLHLWLIKGDEMLSGARMRDLNSLIIANEIDYLNKFVNYERLDKLDELKNICNIFDAKNKIEVTDFDLIPSKGMILDIITRLRSCGKDEIIYADILNDVNKIKKERLANKVPLSSSLIPREDCKHGCRR